MTHPAELLAALIAADATRPRLTAYDATEGPTFGERVELSGRVLGTWVAKAANALQEEWDAGPSTVVRVALPAHWRALAWSLATWSVGGCVALDDGPADVTVAADTALLEAAEGDLVLVTLAALARSAPGPVPAGAMDEARELSTYGDRFVPAARPAEADPALRVGARVTSYASVVPQRDWPLRTRLHVATEDAAELLDAALGVWARDGSLVHSRGPVAPEVLAARLAAERVSAGG